MNETCGAWGGFLILSTVLFISGVLVLWEMRANTEFEPGGEKEWMRLSRLAPMAILVFCVIVSLTAPVVWILEDRFATSRALGANPMTAFHVVGFALWMMFLTWVCVKIAELQDVLPALRRPRSDEPWMVEDEVTHQWHAVWSREYSGKMARKTLCIVFPLSLGGVLLLRFWGITKPGPLLGIPAVILLYGLLFWVLSRPWRFVGSPGWNIRWQFGSEEIRSIAHKRYTRMPWRKIREWAVVPCPGLEDYYVVYFNSGSNPPRHVILREEQYPSREMTRLFTERTGRRPVAFSPLIPSAKSGEETAN